MRKHTETFYANKGNKLAIAVFIPTLLYSKQKFVVHFSNIICTKTRPCAPLFLYQNEPLQHYLSYDLRQMARFLVCSVIFQALRSSFSADSFLGGSFFLRFSVLVRVWLLNERKKYERPHERNISSFSISIAPKR